MSGRLVGAQDLRNRLKAVKLSFKRVGRVWADTAVTLAGPKVPVRTGKLRASFRRTTATQKRARVGGYYTAYFIDAGARYPRVARRGRSGRPARTIFAPKSGFRMQPRPFRGYIAHESLRRHPMAESLIGAWNDAA